MALMTIDTLPANDAKKFITSILSPVLSKTAINRAIDEICARKKFINN